MKVLHIITGLNDGGAEAVLYNLIKSKSSKFHHTVISLLDMGKYGPLLKEAGVNVYCLNLSLSRTVLNFFSIFKMFNLIKKIKPDVVQTWMFHADFLGGIFARLAGIKNVIWGVHTSDLIKSKPKTRNILISKLNAFLSNFVPKKIIYCAQKSREVQESIGFSIQKGIVVNNGHDVSQFNCNNQSGYDLKNDLNISETFLIGNVARYDPQKDHKTLLLALKELKSKFHTKWHCILVGTNVDEGNSELTSLVHELGLTDNVYLIGPRNDIPAVMNAIDLFVLSSVDEAFPNVLNEAMACGAPCVTTDVGDSSIIVGNTGWVVPAQNPELLAESIIYAIHEKNTNILAWKDRKIRARTRIVDNFSIKKMIANYEHVWLEGIKNK